MKLMRWIAGSLCSLVAIGCAPRTHVPDVIPISDALPEDTLLHTGAPDEALAHGNFLRGLALRNAQQPKLAEVFYKRAAANAPGNRFLAFELCGLLLENGKPEDALRVARLAKGYPGTATADQLLVLARIYRDNAILDTAKLYYSQSITANEQNTRALFEYAMLLEQLQDYPELSRIYTFLLPQLGWPRQLVEKQALLLRLNNRDSALVDLYAHAWEYQGSVDYGTRLSESLLDAGREAEAESVLVRLSADTTQDVRRAQSTLAQLYLKTGRQKAALPILRNLFDQDTSLLDLRQRTAMIEFETGESDSARAHFLYLVERRPDDHMSWFYLSNVALVKGDSIAALSAARHAVDSKPDALAYRNQLALLYYLRGDHEQAAQQLDSALAMHPDHPLAHQFKATSLLFHANELEKVRPRTDSLRKQALALRTEAAFHQRAALALDSLEKDTWFDLGANLERMGNLDSARLCFEHLLRIDPRHAMALNYLGYMLTDANQDLPEAGRLIDSALAIDPENLAYLDSRAWWLHRTGKDSAALVLLQQIEKEGQEDPTAWEHIAIVLDALGRTKDAEVYWGKVLSDDPSHEAARRRLGK